MAISIDHVIAGQKVSTLYGHMTYGSRQVGAGQTVQAGQLIGLVGSTGSSTAYHLHFEVHINGSVVDPWAWLRPTPAEAPSKPDASPTRRSAFTGRCGPRRFAVR